MKKNFFKIRVTRLLILLFSTLLILIFITESVEYKKLQQTNSKINELIINSLHRQQYLISMLKGSDYIQVNISNFLYYKDEEKRLSAKNKISKEVLRNDQDQLKYQKLIEDPYEQQLFNRIKIFRKLNAENREEVFRLINQKKYQAATDTIKDQLSDLYENFQRANTTLAAFVQRRDTANIEQAKIQLAKIRNLKIGLNIAMVLLLIGLGFIIRRTVKIMKTKTLDLAKKESKYRLLTEQTNEIIQKCDADDRIVYANDSFKKRFEYNDDELSNLTLSDILLDKTQNLNKARTGFEEVITNVRKVFVSKSGRKIYLEGNILLEYKNKKFIGSTGFFNDVTEKKQLEESLIASEEKFRNFFNLAPIPMWMIDSESYKFIHVNKAAIKHYGYSEKEFLNKTILDIRPEEDISRVKEDILRWTEDIHGPNQQNKVYRGSFRHLKKSNELIEVEIYNTPIVFNNKKDLLSIAIDITERNLNELKISKATIKAQEDERYEIGGELHDNVCQILAAAKMTLSLLKPSLIPSATELFNKTNASIVLATNEIRNLSHRLAPAFFENTTLEERFESLLKTFNVKNTYSIYMYFNDRAKNYRINHDLQLNLYRILQEQLRNIIKYAKSTSIELDVFIHNNKLKMRIADNGVGFNINEVKSGIGLANMKRRAELFAGKIQIETSTGNGCEIVVTIPLHES